MLLDPQVGLTTIVVLAVASQWIAARLRLPSILVLLTVGFIAGPITGAIDPDALLGQALIPFVSLAVAIILFEGGLTLHFRELPEVGSVVLRLISLGAVSTWLVATLAMRFLLGSPWGISVLLGAVVIVTGPTVISPLLRQIRPRGDTGAILRWEGILIDPVGAVLAVLVFEVLIHDAVERAPLLVLRGIASASAVGLVVGGLTALLMVFLLDRHWINDRLQSAFALMLVVSSFTLSNLMVHESGLLTVTMFGMILANQNRVELGHIVEFKESLQVILIGTLFILLSARLELEALNSLGPRAFLLLLVLILVARPLGVFLSTLRTGLSGKERFWMMFMAPRGIVAAAVASVFAFDLEAKGVPGAEQLVPMTFMVIVGTVTVYGLAAGPAARLLGLSEVDPQGVLIVGANPLARRFAKALEGLGIRVLLVDANWQNIREAKMSGLEAIHGNALSDSLSDQLDLWGIGRLMALTPNDEANALAALNFIEDFGRAEVFQLAPSAILGEGQSGESVALRGRMLFGKGITYSELNRRMQAGATIKTTKITERFDMRDFLSTHGEEAIPLFYASDRGKLRVFTNIQKPVVQPGGRIMALVSSEADQPETTPT